MDGMLSDRERRAVLELVVADIVAPVAQVEWVTPPRNWPTHACFRGPTGLVSHLLASREWQETRFEVPRRSVFMVTPNDMKTKCGMRSGSSPRQPSSTSRVEVR